VKSEHLQKIRKPSMKKKIKHFAWLLLNIIFLFVLFAGCFLFILGLTLPDIDSLKDFQLQEPMRIFTKDNKLISEFGIIRRIPVSLDQLPTQLIQATLATEDQRFLSHAGVDPIGILRAGFILLTTQEKQQGGSTITMQVARNFFLTRQKTFLRKIKEVLLAIKIDQSLSKEKILELYLNKVFYGNRAYGIATAAEIYYGKSLNQLSLSEIAMLTGLPKAPSKLNPLIDPEAAKERRNHVLKRMHELNYIDQATYEMATKAPIIAKYHGPKIAVKAPYVAEMIRKSIIKQFKQDGYTQGLNIYTTIDSKLQIAADQQVQNNLLAYDKRHGYRKSEQNFGEPQLDHLQSWINILKKTPTINNLRPGIVLSMQDKTAKVLLKNGHIITLPWSGLSWAREQILQGDQEYLGKKPQYTKDILKIGDLIRVIRDASNHWTLSQIPQVEAALVALNPQNGTILALVGGFDYYNKSKFNRVTQARRQAGSSFKPFIFSAALDKGFTLASLINDAPIVLPDSGENSLWRPENHSHQFYGPTRLRVALMKSRNLVSIRLLRSIGIQYAIHYITRFGFYPEQLPNSLSLALGTAEVTPLQLTAAYATFANGGYKIIPYLIDRITMDHQTIYQAHPKSAYIASKPLATSQRAPHVITSQNAYLITSTLKDVTKHGTGYRIGQALHRNDLAGKTGTTDHKMDTWFCGFNKNLVVTVWIGFDQLRPLHEYAASLAVPLWIDFMKIALKNQPEETMPIPPNMITVRIDKKTGLLATTSNKDTIFETFRQEFAPSEQNNESESDVNQLY
jgi:penicillin-binding protein 1A